MKKILENVRILRESKGYSQENMAELLKITQSSYARFERGATKTDLKTVSQIAKVLEMDLIDIITYPERFVNLKDVSKDTVTSDPEVILQIKITGDKKDQILKAAIENIGLEVNTLFPQV